MQLKAACIIVLLLWKQQQKNNVETAGLNSCKLAMPQDGERPAERLHTLTYKTTAHISPNEAHLFHRSPC